MIKVLKFSPNFFPFFQNSVERVSELVRTLPSTGRITARKVPDFHMLKERSGRTM
jgi:hypothetical protein